MLVPVHWWLELCLGPLVGRAMSRVMSRGGCGLRKYLDSLLVDTHQVGCSSWCLQAAGWGKVLVLIHQEGIHHQRCSRGLMLLSMSPTSVPVLRVSNSQALPLQETPKSADMFGRESYRITAFTLGPGACEFLCVCLWRVKFLFLPPSPSCWAPEIKLHSPSRPNALGGLSSYCHTPELGSLMWGSGLSFLWENLCNILQGMNHPPGRYGILLYHKFTPSPSLIVGPVYVFICRKSFLVGSSLIHPWLFCRSLWVWCTHERRWVQSLSAISASLPEWHS